jgi:hypothetical protein
MTELVEKEKGTELSKTTKTFEINVKKLTALLGGEKNLKQTTVIKKDSLSIIVKDLFKEETELIEKETKEALKSLLKNYIDLQKSIEAKRKELVQLENTKMDEFNKASVLLFNRIEGIDIIEKEYYSALEKAAKAK